MQDFAINLDPFDHLIDLGVTTDHEVAGSIAGTFTILKCGLGLERGPLILVRTTGSFTEK